jgi:hypothetical protein
MGLRDGSEGQDTETDADAIRCCRCRCQLRASLTRRTTTKTAAPSISKLIRTAPTAIPSLSISAAPSPHPHRLADLEWLAERDHVRPGRVDASAAGLQDAVGARLAAVLIAVCLVRDRVECDRVSGVGQVRHPVDYTGHADHRHHQYQQHPDPAECPRDPVPGRVVVGMRAARMVCGERDGLCPDRGWPAPQQRTVRHRRDDAGNGQGAQRKDHDPVPGRRRRSMRLRAGGGVDGQDERYETGNGCPDPALATVQQSHGGGNLRICDGGARL